MENEKWVLHEIYSNGKDFDRIDRAKRIWK